MKKFLKLIVFFTIFLVGAISLTACSTAKAITLEEFKSVMEEKGFEVTDAYVTSDAREGLKADMFDEDKNLLYTIKFYVCNSEETAKKFFQNSLNIFAKLEDKNSVIKNSNRNNSERYTLLGQGYYTIISRIDNTIFFTDALDLYREDIIEISKELGY